MNAELKQIAGVPPLLVEMEIIVDGQVVGSMKPTMREDKVVYMAFMRVGGSLLAMALIGHGDTPELALRDAIECGRSEAALVAAAADRMEAAIFGIEAGVAE